MADPVLDTLEQVISFYNSKTEGIQAAFEWQAAYTHRPNDLQYMLWFAMSTGAIPASPGFQGPGPNGEVYPPEPWLSPEGLPVLDSAYTLDLPYWQKGKDELDRWKRIVERARQGAMA